MQRASLVIVRRHDRDRLRGLERHVDRHDEDARPAIGTREDLVDLGGIGTRDAGVVLAATDTTADNCDGKQTS